ncbi:hypothetical protein H0H92_015114 [Tricholoma furcatifolium]|nr:hypothetical protein H0H92_015114 [Tricholoma furcatifolium]
MGNLPSVYTESLPPKSKFSVDDIPDLGGKVVIVTGSNTYVRNNTPADDRGVGKETVKALLAHNAKVYMAARNPEKAQAAIADLRAQTGKDAIFLKLDLADLKSVKAAAAEFLEKEKELHILFNNGGVMYAPIDDLTADGYDLQMGTNVLGHFYFTKLLLPVLLSTAASSASASEKHEHVRVLTTSSVTHYLAPAIDFATFRDGTPRRRLGTAMLYAQSKLADLVFAVELGRRYGARGVVSMALNPGNLDTELGRHLSWVQSAILKLCLYPAPMGALTQLWGATCEEGVGFNGKYLAPWARVRTPRADSMDPVLGRELWEWMEEQVKDV